MALQAMWIRKNMLQSPGANYERPLTEAEIKVQKSIQKLSIPEWYLNNNSRPPKILTNDTPIESRPSSWKDQPIKKKAVPAAVSSSRCSSDKSSGFLETEIGPSSLQNQYYGTYKLAKKSSGQKSPVATKRSSPKKKSNPEAKSGNSRHLNISQTFPRVSPSRKIENINLIFTEQPKISLIDAIINSDEPETPGETTKDCLNATESMEISNRGLDTSNLTDNCDSTRNSCMEKIYPTPNKNLTYIKPWKSNTRRESTSCVTPAGKFKCDQSFKLRASSTPQGSPVSLFSASGVDDAPLETCKRSPVATPRTFKSNSRSEETCDDCKADPSKSSSIPASQNVRPSSGFRPRNLLATIGENRAILTGEHLNSPTEAFFNSKNKSSHLENIVKRKQAHQQKTTGSKSLVQEIIEELKAKSRASSARPSYVSPGSKNFVKKLVEALESGAAPVSPADKHDEASYNDLTSCQEEDDEYGENDAFIESENGSEDDIKSAASSTSISFKDSDSNNSSSDTDLRSPTMKLDYKYDWNMNLDKNPDEAAKTIVDKENDSVYWIPITKCKLPRTSSLLSMVSRLSVNNTERQSPCVSPIRSTNENSSRIQNVRTISTQSWGTTFRAKRQGGRLLRIDETAVLDSGYSDRSGGRSSGSSIADEHWSDEMDTINSAAETGSYNESFRRLTSIYSQRSLNAGSSFVI